MSDQSVEHDSNTVREVVAMAADTATPDVVLTDVNEELMNTSVVMDTDTVSCSGVEHVATETEVLASQQQQQQQQQQQHDEASDHSSNLGKNSGRVDACDEEIPHEKENSSGFPDEECIDDEQVSMSETDKSDVMDSTDVEKSTVDVETIKTTAENTEMETENVSSTDTNRDVTQEHVVNTSDVTPEHVVNTSDVTTGHVVNTSDVTQEHVVDTRDVTQEHVVNTRDVTSDVDPQHQSNTSDVTPEHVVNTSDVTQTPCHVTKTTASSSPIVRTTRTARVSLVAGYRSDGSESDDSTSSDSSSTTSSSSCQIVRVVQRPDSDEERAKSVKPKTKGELLVEDLPPIEDLCITVDAGTPLVPLGKVTSIISHLVIVQSEPNTAPLDMDSIIFTEDRKSLGQVFETFGPVKCPLYSIRFNTVEQIVEKGVQVGMSLFCAPSVPDYTHFVFMTDLHKMKGSDASWENNNEPPAKFLDYSDDEQERAAKNKKNRKRGNDGNGALEQWPPEDDRDSIDGDAPAQRQGTRAPRGRRGPRPTPSVQQEMSEKQYRPRPHARFGAPPMFPARPMGAPSHMYGMSNMAPPRFVPPPMYQGERPPGPMYQGERPPGPMYQGERPPGPPPHPGYSWQPTPAPVHWPQWPSAQYNTTSWPPAPGSRPPPPGGATYYSSQAEYWSQYGK